MSSVIPIAAIVLALLAAGSIAYIAWELTSKEFHDSFDRAPDEEPSGAADDDPESR